MVLDPPQVLPEARLARAAVRANCLGPGAEGSVQLSVELSGTHQLHVDEPDIATTHRRRRRMTLHRVGQLTVG